MDAAVGIEDLDRFQFGNTPELANRLVSLVIAGRKTASCWAAINDDKVTQPGQRWLALDGGGKPVAVIETASVTRLPFTEVTPAMAALEGEGDLSHAFWADAHKQYFTAEGAWRPEMEVFFEIFRLIEVLDDVFARNAPAEVAKEISEAAARGFNALSGDKQ